MKEIKTKEVVRDIHILDHQVILREGMKQAYVRTKDLGEKSINDALSHEGCRDNDVEDRVGTVLPMVPRTQKRAGTWKKPKSAADSEIGSGYPSDEPNGISTEKERIKTRGRDRVKSTKLSDKGIMAKGLIGTNNLVIYR